MSCTWFFRWTNDPSPVAGQGPARQQRPRLACWPRPWTRTTIPDRTPAVHGSTRHRTPIERSRTLFFDHGIWHARKQLADPAGPGRRVLAVHGRTQSRQRGKLHCCRPERTSAICQRGGAVPDCLYPVGRGCGLGRADGRCCLRVASPCACVPALAFLARPRQSKPPPPPPRRRPLVLTLLVLPTG